MLGNAYAVLFVQSGRVFSVACFYQNFFLFLLSEEVSKQIAEIMENRISELSRLWTRTFEEQIHDQHMTALVVHVTQFFDEVYEESSNRQEAILEKIQSKFAQSLL